MSTIFSVSGGKFHRPAEPIDPSDSGKAWKPTKTACGITVEPLNYFASVDAASDHTGNRLHLFGCKKCGVYQPAPAMMPGYAYEYDPQPGSDNTWSRVSSETWETVVHTPDGSESFVGTRTIDGSRVNVWLCRDQRYRAQVRLG